jgi:hypothetical protein
MDDYRQGDARCRELIVNALLQYANAWTLGRVAEEDLDYRLIAARHAAVLDASENALSQWQALITVPLDQLEAFYARGTKPEDVAALLSALGLGAATAAAVR